jgi:hypothetical protein
MAENDDQIAMTQWVAERLAVAEQDTVGAVQGLADRIQHDLFTLYAIAAAHEGWGEGNDRTKALDRWLEETKENLSHVVPLATSYMTEAVRTWEGTHRTATVVERFQRAVTTMRVRFGWKTEEPSRVQEQHHGYGR